MTAAKRFRTIGMLILISGLLAAIVIFGGARPRDDSGLLNGERYTKRDLLEIEEMGGKSYVLFIRFNDWFASLWHGQRLAYAVAVLSVAGFLSCRHFANSLERSQTCDGPNSPR